jgi:hypothetical protein
MASPALPAAEVEGGQLSPGEPGLVALPLKKKKMKRKRRRTKGKSYAGLVEQLQKGCGFSCSPSLRELREGN